VANKIIIENQEQETPKEEKPKETSRLTGTFQKVADFDFNISREMMVKQIPFGMFIVFLLLIHIWNAHNTEKVIRKTDKLNREIKELRSEYITVLSELMSESKQSAVAKKLDTLGIKELTAPPFKITTSGN
jgi:cell division protein FtsL